MTYDPRRLKKGIPQPEIVKPAKPPIDPEKLECLSDWVIMRRDRNDRTAGGLHIPEAVQQRVGDGVVVQAGPGTWQNGVLVPTGVSKGDRVIMAADADYVELRDQPDLVFIRAAGLFARVRPDVEDLQ